MAKHVLTILVIFVAFCAHGQDFNRPVPPGFTDYEFEKLSDDYNGYYLFSSTRPGNISGLGLMDSDGYLAWATMSGAYMLDFKYSAIFNEFLFSKVSGGGLIHIKLDTGFNEVDTTTIQADYSDSHEHLPLENGNVIIFGNADTVMNLSSYTIAGVIGDSATYVRYNIIQEITPTDSLVFEWRSIDHIHPSEMVEGFDYNPNFLDYAHMNAVSVAQDGNLLVSFRHTSSIVKVNKTTGEVMWRFGGLLSDFEIVNDTMPFYGQHDVRWNSERNTYSLFDNAFGPAGGHFSRALEFDLDTVDFTATLVWAYAHTPVVTSQAQGSHRILDDGFHIIGWGDSRRPEPTFTMVDDLGNVVSNLFLKDSFISYRAYAVELPFEFNRPEIECSYSNDSIFLTAPESTYYLWSSGESTRTISVSDTGEYVVYLDRGIGLAASRPFVVSSLSGCGNVGIDDDLKLPISNSIIAQVYDLAGRRISHPIKGQLYVVAYENGASELKIWKETDGLDP